MITSAQTKPRSSEKKKEEKSSLIWRLDKSIQAIYNVCMNTQTFNIALPRELVKRVDLTAKQEYKNRSELIRAALVAYLRNKNEWNQIFSSFGKAAKKAGITTEKQVNEMVREHRHGKRK